MTYLSGKAQQRKKITTYIIYGVIFFIVLLFWPFFRKHLYMVIEPAVSPYTDVKGSFTIFPEFFSTYVTSHKELSSKQKSLEIEVERLENELAQKDALLREAGVVTTIVASSSVSTMLTPPLVMYPLMQDKLKLYSTILLSKGYSDGVEIGDMVYVRGKQAVCTIKEVYKVTSVCQLLSASGITTEGVTSSSSIALSLVGRGGYYLASIVRDTPVEVGEKVYVRDDPSMVLGTVSDVSHNDQDTSWFVFVRGAYNPVTSSVFYVQE